MDAVRGDVAAVDDVLEGLKALAGQLFVDTVEGIDVLLRRRASDHLHDGVRARLVTGLGLVAAIADPIPLAGRGDLLAVPSPARLNLDRKTVRRFRNTDLDQLLASARERRPNGVLEPFKAYVNDRFAEAQGQVNGTRLFLEIQARGYHGSRQVVRKHIAALRAGTAEPVRPTSPAPARSPPGSCGPGRPSLTARTSGCFRSGSPARTSPGPAT
ncbi:hypothetical protein AB0N07_47850 [Streptomyces sp. NPDC051172]|uniref:hypothetical protein n=1 Tax=Streptomyces sp. NPDC051172 TaxID=3155796 RepID=UPI003420D419